MYLDDKISKEAYDDKYSEIGNKLDKCEEEKHLFSDCVLSQKNIVDKMKLIRQKIKGDGWQKHTICQRPICESLWKGCVDNKEELKNER